MKTISRRGLLAAAGAALCPREEPALTIVKLYEFEHTKFVAPALWVAWGPSHYFEWSVHNYQSARH